MAVAYYQMQRPLAVVGQMAVQAMQQHAPGACGPTGEDSGRRCSSKKELHVEGYDDIEVFGGGEDGQHGVGRSTRQLELCVRTS